MAHPQMFDDDDPLLARVRGIARGFPGANEKVSHGRPAFFTTKVFAYYGGSLRVGDEWVQHPHSIVLQPDPDERPALLADPRTFVPAYLGPSGWLGVDLDGEVDWGEVTELLDASYRQTAPRRLVLELDASPSPAPEPAPTKAHAPADRGDTALPRLGAPALRALASVGVTTLDDLTAHRASDLLALHGFGPKALGLVEAALAERGTSLRP